MSDKETLKQINIEIKKLMIDCIYSGRGHQQTGQFWSAINHKLGIPGIIISSILGVGAAGTALLGNKWISATLAILSVVLAGLNSFLKPNDISDIHLIKGAQFISIRNRARLLQKVEISSGISVKDIITKLTLLRAEYDGLNIKPPRNIPRFAYIAAKKNIAKGESDYENDPLWKTLD
jgi:hypothetical protein